MTVCFKGNNFKYEVESVIKLFFPVKRFEFKFDCGAENITGDCCLVSVEAYDNKKILSVKARLDGKEIFKSLRADVSSSAGNEELGLCRLLYLSLCELTGTSQKWGCLTGIRPVKRVRALIDKGMSEREIIDFMGEEYFVSPEKTELAFQTAENNGGLVKSVGDNSFSLYISIPFCPSRCAYCSFVSHSVENDSAKKLLPRYVSLLCEEIRYAAKIADELGLSADTVYIGGGTPAVLDSAQAEAVMTAIRESFDLSALREYTIEAGRADVIDEKKLETYIKNGADRISINPQTMNDRLLEELNRKHNSEDVEKAFRYARAAGFKNINMDVIAGLPGDVYESFTDTIGRVSALSPEGVTVHSLTYKRAAGLFGEGERGFNEEVYAMTEYGRKALQAEGYIPYYLYRQKNTAGNLENTGYSKKGRECLYNIFIMEEAQTILSVGAGGSTKLVSPMTGRIERIMNYKYPYEYISGFEEILKRKTKIINFFEEEQVR